MESTSQYDSLDAVDEVLEAVSECGDKAANPDTHAAEELPASNELHALNEMKCSVPFVGMEFDSHNKAFLFYNEYARIVGFSVRKGKVRRSNINGAFLFRRFCCSKEGFPRKSCENGNNQPNQVKDGVVVKVVTQIQPTTRVGCNARLDVKKTTDGRWVVQNFVEEHNHECAGLGETHLLRSHKHMQSTQGQQVNTMPEAGMRPKQMTPYLTGEAGGSENVGDKVTNPDTIAAEELPLPNKLCALNEVSSSKPYVGMEFDSPHKAYLFYNEYARIVGFSVRKAKNRRSNINGALLFCRFCCSKEGYRRNRCGNDNDVQKRVKDGVVVKVKKQITPSTRVGCSAKLDLKKTIDGKWFVQKFVEEHNHECASLGELHLLRSHKRIKFIHGEPISTITDASTRPKKVLKRVVSYLTREAGGNENVGSIESCLRNRINKKRRKKLEKGEAQVLFNYFRQMQTENPSFYYAIEVDEEDQMLNFFWADARSRMDFRYFGDVICFETTYGTNKYGRPFTPIVGVNHHLQTVLFGCAILLNETKESFAWLLETFLHAMSGCNPVAIITDQDAEMAKAIEQVLPGTHHCLSLCHIFQNSAKNLSHLYNTEGSFSTDFKKCIYEPQCCDEFESRWVSLLDKYKLHDNEWLNNMYNKRHKWVPVYSRHIFHADMTTTQRSESIHSFFDGYLNRSLSLSEFVKQYENALVSSREKETYEDFKSHQTRLVLKSDLPMEKQAAGIYTISVFNEFQKEFCGSFNHIAEETERVGTNRTFMVSRLGQNSKCLVNFNSCDKDIQVTCSCQNFEFMGILCRHILTVFTVINVMLVPEAYIKKRWTKRAKCGVVPDKSEREMQGDCQKSLALRYSDLCHLALNLSTRGAISIKAYQIAKCTIEMTLKEMENVAEEDFSSTQIEGIISSHRPVEVVKNIGSSTRLVDEDNQTLTTVNQIASFDPPCVRTGGQPFKRITTSLGETQRQKKVRTGPESSYRTEPPSHSKIRGTEV